MIKATIGHLVDGTVWQLSAKLAFVSVTIMLIQISEQDCVNSLVLKCIVLSCISLCMLYYYHPLVCTWCTTCKQGAPGDLTVACDLVVTQWHRQQSSVSSHVNPGATYRNVCYVTLHLMMFGSSHHFHLMDWDLGHHNGQLHPSRSVWGWKLGD